MTLDVGVHDGFEVLEFAVLEEVDDVNLQTRRKQRRLRSRASLALLCIKPTRASRFHLYTTEKWADNGGAQTGETDV